MFLLLQSCPILIFSLTFSFPGSTNLSRSCKSSSLKLPTQKKSQMIILNVTVIKKQVQLVTLCCPSLITPAFTWNSAIFFSLHILSFLQLNGISLIKLVWCQELCTESTRLQGPFEGSSPQEKFTLHPVINGPNSGIGKKRKCHLIWLAVMQREWKVQVKI